MRNLLNITFILCSIIYPLCFASSFKGVGPIRQFPQFDVGDRRNPHIIENGLLFPHHDVMSSRRRKTAYMPKDDRWLMVSILQADALNNTFADLELLKKARESVFAEFRKASPDYTEAQWDQVKRLDPLFRPSTFVIIIQDPNTGEVIGNLKLMYDHPDHPLPVDMRFLGRLQRSVPEQGEVHLFNIIQGKLQKFTDGPIGGAIQVMELFGPGLTSELFFLANLVLAEHPTVRYRFEQKVYEAYPKEIVGYGVASEMGAYHGRIGLKIVDREGDYLMHKMPIRTFQSLYRDNFLFRPGSKKLNKTGFLLQTGSDVDVMAITSIFDQYKHHEIVANMGKVTDRLYRLEGYVNYERAEKNPTPISQELIRYFDYFRWASSRKNWCLGFYQN